ncbi:M6 family metalloprotease domain-containing protein [Oceanobacter mangrovi]|uniref:M6 family metalloprotease domain-containing protein n=1 Tax=Oceanobacter mangrovi TaxID=2862510 RepID=UPI001C8D8BF2|nr:M6 family metalloprotease domain-containing protein [Oceanobacter mangrovi]
MIIANRFFRVFCSVLFTLMAVIFQAPAALASLPALDGSRMPLLEQQALESQSSVTHSVISSDADINSLSTDVAEQQQPLIVIRVAFNDQPLVYSAAQWQQQLFDGSRSVAGYFNETSYGVMQLQAAFDGVIDIQLDQNHPDFGSAASGNSASLAQQVLTAASQQGLLDGLQQLDLNQDGQLATSEAAVLIVVAGYEQAYAGSRSSHPRIWAHQTSLGFFRLDGLKLDSFAMVGEQHEDHMATIGVICHELGHLLLGLPDMQDNTGIAEGIGRWGLMGLGGWNGIEQAGDSPSHLLAWSKDRAGFLQPEVATAGVSEWQLDPASESDDVVEIPLDEYQHGERVLVEYRNRIGYDQAQSGNRLLVSQVDDRLLGLVGSSAVVSQATSAMLLSEDEYNLTEALVDQPIYSSDGGELVALISGEQLEGEQASENQALLRVERFSDAGGRSFGYDQRIATGFWSAGVDESLLMRVALSDLSAVEQLEGLDLFAAAGGSIELEIRLLDQADDLSGGELLYQDSLSLEAGWNRILTGAIDVSQQSGWLAVRFYVDTPNGTTLGLDTVTAASGELYQVYNGTAVAEDYDLNLKLLYRTGMNISYSPVQPASDAAIDENAVVDDSADVAESGSDGSSGGGSGGLLVILAAGLLLARRAVKLA